MRGYDHLLFVFALILIVRSTRSLVWTITAFTLAHSITLALATLDVVHVPGPPIEAAIAFSILLLAAEIVRLRRGEPSLTARWPWVVAFWFGLLHGFGFAGALSELGLPRGDIPLALFAFNVGVELGQLAFIAAVLGCLAIVRRVAFLRSLERARSECRAVRDRIARRVLVHRARRDVLGVARIRGYVRAWSLVVNLKTQTRKRSRSRSRCCCGRCDRMTT